MKENNNGNDTNVGNMENSIEEDIKNAKHFINSIKTDKEYKEENGWHGYYNKEIVELARILEHILSDYKRVSEINEVLLKENEELKEINNELEAEKNEAIRRYNFETIPIKKVKDKIEELNKAYEDSKDENGESEYYYPDYTIRVLEELLESE